MGPDERQRKLGRMAASGDLSSEVKLLRERLRAGQTTPALLRLAAHLGHEPAWRALDEDRPRSPRPADEIRGRYEEFKKEQAGFRAVMKAVAGAGPQAEGRARRLIGAFVQRTWTSRTSFRRSQNRPVPELPRLDRETPLADAAESVVDQLLAVVGFKPAPGEMWQLVHWWQEIEGELRVDLLGWALDSED